MALHPPRIDMHEIMLAEMNEAIDRITLRSPPKDLPRHVKFNTILVGHDATEESQHALEWAASIARIHGSEVIVASISTPIRTYGDGPVGMGSYWPGMLEEYRRAEHQMVEASENGAAYLRVNGVKAHSVSSRGSAASELARLSRGHDAHLVVVGASERGRLNRALLGSVAGTLAGRVDASVLLARGEPDLRRVLVATDGSPDSDRAVTLALKVASERNADLVVQHVLEYPGERATLPPEGFLQGIIERMDLPLRPHIRYVIDVGWPAEKIVERAAAEGCHLIVLGAHGVGRVRGALLGSVCHRVANTSQASVLLVRGGRDP